MQLFTHIYQLKLIPPTGKRIDNFDEHIAQRYDGISGGQYYITVYSLYFDGVLRDEDIREFDDEIYNKLKEDKEFFLKK